MEDGRDLFDSEELGYREVMDERWKDLEEIVTTS